MNDTLAKLQEEGRKKIYDFPGKCWLDTVNVSIAHGELCSLLDSLTEKAFLAGIEATWGVRPLEKEEAGYGFYLPEREEYNKALKEWDNNIEQLLAGSNKVV